MLNADPHAGHFSVLPASSGLAPNDLPHWQVTRMVMEFTKKGAKGLGTKTIPVRLAGSQRRLQDYRNAVTLDRAKPIKKCIINRRRLHHRRET